MKAASKRALEELNVDEESQPRKKARLGEGLKWHKTLKVGPFDRYIFIWAAESSDGDFDVTMLGLI